MTTASTAGFKRRDGALRCVSRRVPLLEVSLKRAGRIASIPLPINCLYRPVGARLDARREEYFESGIGENSRPHITPIRDKPVRAEKIALSLQ